MKNILMIIGIVFMMGCALESCHKKDLINCEWISENYTFIFNHKTVIVNGKEFKYELYNTLIHLIHEKGFYEIIHIQYIDKEMLSIIYKSELIDLYKY